MPEVDGVLRAVPVQVDPPTVETVVTPPANKEPAGSIPTTDSPAMSDPDPAAPPRVNIVEEVEETGDEIEYENE